MILGKVGSKNQKQNSDPSEVKIVDGTTSYLAKQQLETLNDLDQETFLRHSEIQDTVYLRLDFLRDFKNCLELLSLEDHVDFTEAIESDSTRTEIMKLATREFHQKGDVRDLIAEKVTKQNSVIYGLLGDGAAPILTSEK